MAGPWVSDSQNGRRHSEEESEPFSPAFTAFVSSAISEPPNPATSEPPKPHPLDPRLLPGTVSLNTTPVRAPSRCAPLAHLLLHPRQWLHRHTLQGTLYTRGLYPVPCMPVQTATTSPDSIMTRLACGPWGTHRTTGMVTLTVVSSHAFCFFGRCTAATSAASAHTRYSFTRLAQRKAASSAVAKVPRWSILPFSLTVAEYFPVL